MPARLIPHLLALFRDGGSWLTAILAAPFITTVLNSPSFWGSVVAALFVFTARIIEVRSKITYWKWRAEKAEAELKRLQPAAQVALSDVPDDAE